MNSVRILRAGGTLQTAIKVMMFGCRSRRSILGLGCEGHKVAQGPKPRKFQSNEQVSLGADPKVTKGNEKLTQIRDDKLGPLRKEDF